jgi:hypothetical protein
MKNLSERVKRIIELKPKESSDVYDHLCVEFESLAKEIHNEALEEAIDACRGDCDDHDRHLHEIRALKK